jgi:hypothetical protein
MNGNETSEIEEFKMYPKDCCGSSHFKFDQQGTVTKAVGACGWDAAFEQCPNGKLSETHAVTGEMKESELRGCEIEMTDDLFV